MVNAVIVLNPMSDEMSVSNKPVLSLITVTKSRGFPTSVSLNVIIESECNPRQIELN